MSRRRAPTAGHLQPPRISSTRDHRSRRCTRGLRFANRPAAHVAVVDYAFAVKLVNRTEWAQLDELRDLRHKTNYPSDLVEPTDTELDQFATLTDTVIARAQTMIAPIPQSPSR